ncbi:FadR/GntR family transcriptional regulator [Neorhizobium sp. T25_13]|uniref:FadR/GntR family transcriptional regulator n=1 Tax=Neorhizobium sp. T25_13 TaxID=2093830 RepID=UPI00155EE8A4|nr:FadR/GntR family transcriptional regulator [Neorhizobium sp. T25_13]
MFDVKVENLARARLSDTVVQHMAGWICNGSLKPGDELPAEAELARRFAVSKAVVREALQRMGEMGVVEIRHGKSTTIREQGSEPLAQYFQFAVRTSANGLREVVELRRALETNTVSLAARHITETELDELRRQVDILDANRTNSQVWIPTNAVFHMILVKASRNVLMTRLFEALSGPIEESMRRLHSERAVRDPDETFRRHVDILNAVAARDPQAAFAAMQRHFDATEPAIVAVLSRETET